jgi:hypothetical protein
MVRYAHIWKGISADTHPYDFSKNTLLDCIQAAHLLSVIYMP